MLVKPFARLSVVLIVTLLAAAAFAATTGKIAGTVTDKQTGEPLPGVNVVIAGTNIGAATNIQGEFFIINVPPGNYTLKVNLIGYRPVEVTNVVVTVDLTTRVDLELETETIDMGTITVEAERPLIEKDVTSSRMLINSDQITSGAVNGLVNSVALNAGNVLGSFRGSRDGTGEVVYLLDGVNMANPLGAQTGVTPGQGTNSALATTIPDESISEAEVLTGGFGAEYPSVQSAVINVVSKEGTKKFAGKFKTRSSTDAIFGWDIYGKSSYTSTGAPTNILPVKDADGNITSFQWTDNPLLDDHRRYKIEDERQHDWFLSGPVPLQALDIPGEMTFSTGGTYNFNRDFRDPDNWSKTQSVQGKLAYNLSSSKKLTLSGLTSYNDYMSYDQELDFITTWGKTQYFTGPIFELSNEGWFRPQEIPEGSELYYVKTPDGLDTVYTYTPYSWIVAPGFNYTTVDSAFFSILNGMLGLAPGDAGYYASYPSGEFPDADVNGVSLLGAVGNAADSVEALGMGRTYTNYNNAKNRWRADGRSNQVALNFTNNLSPKSFYTLILSRFYTAKTIRQYDPWDLHPLTYDEMHDPRFISMGVTQNQGFNVNPMYLNRRRTGDDYQTIYNLKGDFTSQLNSMNLLKMGFDYKKYDLYKNHTEIASGGNDYNDQFHVKPFEIGAYAQNKLESEGMILNVGLRYDFFNPKTFVPASLNDPLLEEFLNDPQNISSIFQPQSRLKGAINAKTKSQLSPRIGISYPISEKDVLHVTYGHYFQLPELFYLYQNLGYDLRGAFKYIGNPNLDVEKTIAYEAGLEHGFNDYLKVAVTGFYKDISNLVTFKKTIVGSSTFWINTNSDYARVKGFEFTLTQRTWHGLSGLATYTYQIARGRASSGYQTFQDDYDNRKPRTEDYPLDWDQRNTARVNLNYQIPLDWGPVINEYHFLGDWALDFFWTYGSGTPYTSSSNVPQPAIPPVNDKTFPASWQIDVRAEKGFQIYQAYRANFFVEVRNLTNRANIVQSYDVERYDLTGFPGGQFADPDVYNAPRRIMLGMEFVF